MSPAKQPSESHWANLRDTQSKTLALPHTGQAVIIDIGEENDIHPRTKQDVGKRLALHALHNDYGYNSIVCTGPIFQSVKRIGDALEVTFNACDEQLVARNKYGYLSGFAIAGADGKYQWAQAKIENNKVIVWNKEIQQPSLYDMLGEIIPMMLTYTTQPVCLPRLSKDTSANKRPTKTEKEYRQ